MSRIQIECDGCGKRVALPVRHNHEARIVLEKSGWISKGGGGGNRFGRGTLKEDYCPDCRS